MSTAEALTKVSRPGHCQHRADEDRTGDQTEQSGAAVDGQFASVEIVGGQQSSQHQIVGADDDGGIVAAAFRPFEELAEAEFHGKGQGKLVHAGPLKMICQNQRRESIPLSAHLALYIFLECDEQSRSQMR